MSRLIDADDLKHDHHMGDECDKCETKWRECQYDYIYSKMDFCTWIDDAPTVNAVSVVRCGKCGLRYKPLDDDARNEVFCLFMNCTMMKDDFCSRGRDDGERKEKSDG